MDPVRPNWLPNDGTDDLLAAAEILAASGIFAFPARANISARLDRHRMLLSGNVTGIDYADLAIARFDDVVEWGQLQPPTAAIVSMHTVIYRSRLGARAVLHLHSPNLLAFALAHRPLPCRYEPLLLHGQRTAVPVIPWAQRGSPALAESIADALEANPATHAVLLANHGALVVSSSAEQVARTAIVLEEAAGAELRAATLGGARDFPTGTLADPQNVHR